MGRNGAMQHSRLAFRTRFLILVGVVAVLSPACGGGGGGGSALPGGSNAPTITLFSPLNGTVGTAVTITGTNFDSTAANNTVAFNGTTAAVVSATSTELIANVPVGATS